MQDTKPRNLFRTTYRDMRSPHFETSHGFITDFAWLNYEAWTGELTKEVIEQHLDRDTMFPLDMRMLISTHSDLERAVRYAKTQRERLFFDSTYQDPNVRLYVIDTEALTWEEVPLTGRSMGKTLRVLRGPGCCFFSTADARRTFGPIHSRWATEDEWFAIGNIPPEMVVKHFQLADGLTLDDYGSPYKLLPVRPEALPDPDDLVSFGGSIKDLLEGAAQRCRDMSEEEQDRQHTAAMEREEEHPKSWRSMDGPIWSTRHRGNQIRYGEWRIVRPDPAKGTRVLVV